MAAAAVASPVVAPYSHDHFQSLPMMGDARDRFLASDGEALVANFIKPFFVAKGMDRTLGLAMMHRHFDLHAKDHFHGTHAYTVSAWATKEGGQIPKGPPYEAPSPRPLPDQMDPQQRQFFKSENILAAISALGINSEGFFLDSEFRGGQCHIFKLSPPADAGVDTETLAMRVPAYMDPGCRDAKIDLRTELRTLQTLQEKGFPWAPRCRGSSLSFDNAVRHPFVLLTWVDGVELSWDENVPARAVRDKVLAQMAAIQLTLIECTQENGVATAAAYLKRLAANRLTRVTEGKMPGLSEQDCADQQALLAAVLGPDGEDTALAMDHGDFKPDNVIVDEEYNIKGVIDWAFAGVVPMARAAGLPRFLWPTDLLTAPSPTIRADRQAYIAAVAAHPSQAASCMRRWQTVRDVDIRTLFLESLFSKGMHAALARVGWKLPYSELVVQHAAEEQRAAKSDDGGDRGSGVLGREAVA
ncbi:hypothetical protein OQA88_13281 [Cercophora sp. LCS_1]